MKTRLEVYEQTYLRISDIQILLKRPWAKSKEIYLLADAVDDEELGKFRTEPRMVRATSVYKVTGINANLLLKQIKSGIPPAK